MADQSEIDELKRLIGESTTLTDEELGAIIDNYGSIREAARVVWESVAADSVQLVNITEAGSSRSLSDVHKHALEMARYYSNTADGDNELSPKGRSGTRQIVRP